MCKLMCSIILLTTIHVITRDKVFLLFDQILLSFQELDGFSLFLDI